jgi:hypothetical protein
MKRIPVTDNFYLDEFIDPVTYSARGERAIQLMDYRIICAIDYLRRTINRPIIINNWSSGGQFRLRGFRPEGTRTGAKYSQHKFGRALDFHVPGMTVADVHKVIQAHSHFFIESGWLTTIEDPRDSPTWTHIDCRFTGTNEIVVVRA